MTNDGMLSQDEIDALLKVGADEDEQEQTAKTNNVADFLSKIEEDTLGEIGNISFGSSATTLSTLLNQKVAITTPEVSIIGKEDIDKKIDFSHVTIQVNYIEGFTGKNILVMKSEDAAVIADIMLGGNGTTPEKVLSEIHLSAIQETMNQMMGTAATSMSAVFDKRVDISPPSIELEGNENAGDMDSISNEDIFVKVSFQLKVGNLIDSSIMQLIPLPFAKQLADQLLHPEPAKDEAAVALEQLDKPTTKEKQNKQEPTWNKNNPQYLGDSFDQKNTPIQQATFSDFEQIELSKNEQRNLDMLLDIPLKVTVELGRTKRTIKDILDLSSGSVIELDKLAGEPVDVLVNEKLVAKGEVVVIDENFGVRVTDILSQSERLMKLNK